MNDSKFMNVDDSEENGKVIVLDREDKEPMFPDGPFKVSIELAIRAIEELEDGSFARGYANIEMRHGRVLTDQQITDMVNNVMPKLAEQGFRVLTREEFGQLIFEEHTGTNGIKMAVPNSNEPFRLEVFND